MALTEFTETVVTRIVSRLGEQALMRQLRIKHDLYARNVARVREVGLDTESLAKALTESTNEAQADALEGDFAAFFPDLLAHAGRERARLGVP